MYLFNRQNIKSLVWLVVFCVVGGFLSCDNSLDPLNEEKGLYSIYGYLHLYNEVNYIRVKNLNKPLSEMNDDSIDAKVEFENLVTGDTEVLKDSVVSFDGIKTHNFGVHMDLQPDTKYQVRVQRSDGKERSATATMPPIAGRSLSPPSGANCTTAVNLEFEPMRDKFAINLEVGIPYNEKTYWAKLNNRLIDAGNRVRLNITPWNMIKEVFGEDTAEINPGDPLYEAPEIFCDDLSDDTYRVRYTHFGPGLNRNTVSDTLGVPGSAGRFGGLYSDSFSFEIDTVKLCPPLEKVECVRG